MEDGKDYDPNTRPSTISEGLLRARKKIGPIPLGDLTGRRGKDPLTGAPIAESSSQPMQARRDLLAQQSQQEEKKTS